MQAINIDNLIKLCYKHITAFKFFNNLLPWPVNKKIEKEWEKMKKNAWFVGFVIVLLALCVILIKFGSNPSVWLHSDRRVVSENDDFENQLQQMKRDAERLTEMKVVLSNVLESSYVTSAEVKAASERYIEAVKQNDEQKTLIYAAGVRRAILADIENTETINGLVAEYIRIIFDRPAFFLKPGAESSNRKNILLDTLAASSQQLEYSKQHILQFEASRPLLLAETLVSLNGVNENFKYIISELKSVMALNNAKPT